MALAGKTQTAEVIDFAKARQRKLSREYLRLVADKPRPAA
jgi:hypothetical protein